MSRIKTRYRDIDFSELRRLHKDMHFIDGDVDWETQMRGRSITIQTPPSDLVSAWGCSGPWYVVIEGQPVEYRNAHVCPHLAEIGD